jgi:Domain of unknown function (DUF6268)
MKKIELKSIIFNNRGINRLSFIIFLSLFFLLLSDKTEAQPYLDIVNLKYTNSPNAGLINQNKNDVKIQYFRAGTNLPILFKNKKDAVIFSPFFEKWWVQINKNNWHCYYSMSLPVSLSKTIPNSRWGILLTGILRMNDNSINTKTKMQFGGAFILSNIRNKKLTWKLGVYINNELFGVFVMPLAGIDWKINERNSLFGVLPGNLTYEHKINEHFYCGANFNAITNSYANTSDYWRIDENQLGLYLDTYLKKKLVLNIEAGHSVFRKIKTGLKGISKYDLNVNDNYYLKLSFAFRERFK